MSNGLVIKKSNIRIWIHRRNLEKLQRVVWEGHGSKLLVEHSNNGKIKKFLEAVPRLMRLIQDVHSDVQKDDIDALKLHTQPPVPDIVFSGKDGNGLTPLHKAAGLGKQEIAEYIVQRYPLSVNLLDNEGRTPLHYAALPKDSDHMYDYLIVSGADESILDNKQRTAAYYKLRNGELDPKLLQVVPDCPRLAHDAYPANWDWSLISAATPTEEAKKLFGQTPEKENGIPEILKSENNDEKKTEVNAAVVDTNDNNIEQNGHVAETEIAPEVPTVQKPEVEVSKVEKEAAIEEPKNEERPEIAHTEIEQPETAEDVVEAEVAPDTEKVQENDEELERPLTRPGTRWVRRETRTATIPSATGNHVSEVNADKNDVVDKPEERKEEEEEEGIIEGVVNGENEIESLNEEGQGLADTEEDSEETEVRNLIETGNMEQLAAMVLNGFGGRLMGHHSDNPELQAFLDNVAVYMTKIKKIHVAARDGSLRDLQAALDRRKFAIAKESISPNGATPLHVATVFGNTSIVRYLAGRFPETLQTQDDNGRTPLHYAAVIADNGHYYNLLMHLGANNKVEDKFQRSPEFYKTYEMSFNHKSLLDDFGASDEVVAEILQDKAKKNLDDEDMCAVLEKCFNVLHGRRSSTVISASSTSTAISMLSSPSTSSVLYKHMRRYIFDAVKERVTKLDHNLYDIIWPSVKKLPQEPAFRVALEQDFPAGIIAPDYYVYTVFSDFLEPIIKEVNCIDVHMQLLPHPESNFVSDTIDEDKKVIEIELDLDPHCKNVLTGTLDCTRNLEGFELPKYLNVGQLEEVERILTTALLCKCTASALYPNATADDVEEKGSGTYYTMNEVLEDPSEARVILAANGLLIPLWNIPESDRLHGKHWPYGRGVFISNSCNLAAWINVLDHLRIVTCTSPHKPGNIGQIYSRINRLMSTLSEKLSFKQHEKFGHLTARPTCLGNTLQFNLSVRFPHLIKEPDNLRHLCLVRALNYHKSSNNTDVVRIGNRQCLGVSELQTFEDFTTAAANILQLEKDLAMSNSLHIAALFVNMFRRKKASLLDA